MKKCFFLFFAATFASFFVALDMLDMVRSRTEVHSGVISRRSPAVRQRVMNMALPYRYVFGASEKGFCVKALNEE